MCEINCFFTSYFSCIKEEDRPLLSVVFWENVREKIHIPWPESSLVAVHEHVSHRRVREFLEKELKRFHEHLLPEDLST